MDQIFDRLERLFKSWTAPEAETRSSGTWNRRGGSDPDLDAAMEELDNFLDTDRLAAEKREAERLAREARERSAREAGAREAAARHARPSGPDPRIVSAYQTMGLRFGAPFVEVKAAYKKLLMKHHPDRHSGDQAAMKKATEISAKINEAYRLLEVYCATGSVPRE